jgi:hypothetical protein
MEELEKDNDIFPVFNSYEQFVIKDFQFLEISDNPD